MKLTDLNPHFIGAGGEGISNADGSPVPTRPGGGLVWACPCGCGSNLYVPFANPVDGGLCLSPERPSWNREGETFEKMTLSPSIKRIPHRGSCGWHGFIKKGMIETCSDSIPATEEFKR